MLQVIPEGNDLGTPKRFEEFYFIKPRSFVYIGFILSRFQLKENRISDKSIYK